MGDLAELTERLRNFRDERGWLQYHSPKNLAMALASEVGELLAELRWLTESESESLADPASTLRPRVEDEVADVMLFLVMLADRLGIDLLGAASDKLHQNATRFPVPNPSQVPE